jgi:quinol monooxygenase YgiN
MLRDMIVTIATLQAKPEHADEVESSLRAIERHTRTEPGAVAYSVLRQPGDRFVVFEKYRDPAARDEHFAADYVTGFLARAGVMLTDEPRLDSGVELAGFSRV